MQRFTHGALIVIMMTGCHGWRHQNRVVEDLSAATYTITTDATTTITPRTSPLHTIRLHVMADASYRREQLRWRQHIEEQVEGASAELRALFGVELQIVTLEEWEHDGGARSLDEALAALRAAHPVTDAEDRVLGFTSSLPSPTAQQHKLGAAYELGEHLILRGMQDHAERELIRDSLSARTRHLGDAIYSARLVHKRTTVLLHELGHSFGAMHVKTGGQLMSPSYDHKTQRFSPINTHLLKTAFAAERDLDDRTHGAWQKTMLVELRRLSDARDPQLNEIPRSDVTRLLTRIAQDTSHERMALDGVRHAMREARFEEGWHALKPLLDDPDAASLEAIQLACALRHELDDDDVALALWCAQAVRREVDVAFAANVLVELALKRDDMAQAFVYNDVLEQALEADPATPSKHWLILATHYARGGSLARAERVAARAGMTRAASTLRDTVTLQRHTYGMFEVAEDREHMVMQAAVAVSHTLHEHAPEAHEEPLKALEALAPDSAPVHVQRCLVAIARQHKKTIISTCEETARRVPWSAMALYGLGIAQMLRDTHDDAHKTFERAIALEPRIEASWHMLARHLAARDATQALNALRARYIEQFTRTPTW